MYWDRIGSRWLRVEMYRFRHISTSGLTGSGCRTPFAGKVRCKRLKIDARPICGRFGSRPTSDFSTSCPAETESSFFRPNGGPWAYTLYWGRTGSRWLRIFLYGFRHISTSGLAVSGIFGENLQYSPDRRSWIRLELCLRSANVRFSYFRLRRDRK